MNGSAPSIATPTCSSSTTSTSWPAATHAGGVLPHLQHAVTEPQADHPGLRLPAERDPGIWKSGWSRVSTGAWSRGSRSPATRRASRSSRRRARLRGLQLPDDVVWLHRRQVENNTRELEGAITKIQGMACSTTADRPRPRQAALGESHARAEAHHRSSRSSTPSRSTTTSA
jgi:hypothetical protein